MGGRRGIRWGGLRRTVGAPGILRDDPGCGGSGLTLGCCTAGSVAGLNGDWRGVKKEAAVWRGVVLEGE